MKKLLFSIIIPTLNEAQYLPSLLADLKRQKLSNFEVIVVDGKSEDTTQLLAQSFAQFFPLKIQNVAKRNVAYQRNMGALAAKGSFLLFLDADARVYPSFTTKVARAIFFKKALIFLPYLLPDEGTPTNKIIFNLLNSLVEASQSLGKPLSPGGAIFIEKNLFALLHGFNEKLFVTEDHNLIQRAYAWGVKAKCLRDTKVIFSLRRMRKEGQARVAYKYFLSSFYMLMKGEITKKIYAYNMGGQEYTTHRVTAKMAKKSPWFQTRRFFDYISQLERNFSSDTKN